jgi:hypothetical protein
MVDDLIKKNAIRMPDTMNVLNNPYKVANAI